MIKITTSVLVAAAMLIASSAFAGDKACCAKGASHTGKKACASFDNLGLTAEQKSKMEVWQADCMKAGCTEESRVKFLKQAKGILTADQFAKVKELCDKTAKKSEA
jgi:Spy/CpxP family protein refolding chaperone